MRQLALQIYQSWRSSKASSKPRFRWLPWVISLLAIGYVVYRLMQEDARTWENLWPLQSGFIIATLVACVLLPLNWGLESEKWRMLVQRWYPGLRLPDALRAVFCGISTGIFTPNRIGEYPGRIMTLPAGYRWEAASTMLVDRLIQMVITIWLGAVSLYLLEGFMPASWYWMAEWLPYLTGFSLALPFIVLMFSRQFISLFPSHGTGARFKSAFSTISLLDMVKLFSLSLLRNVVFTTQFLLLLYGLGMTIGLQTALAMVWLIFFVKSFIPAWTITELGIRETIAISVLGLAAVPASIAFSATFLLYVINLIIPALIGLRWIHKINW